MNKIMVLLSSIALCGAVNAADQLKIRVACNEPVCGTWSNDKIALTVKATPYDDALGVCVDITSKREPEMGDNPEMVRMPEHKIAWGESALLNITEGDDMVLMEVDIAVSKDDCNRIDFEPCCCGHTCDQQ